MRLGAGALRAVNAVFSRDVVRRLLSVPGAAQQRDLEEYYRLEQRRGVLRLAEFGADGDVVGKRVLDLGCGLGAQTLAVAAAGAARAVGIDIDVGKIRHARREAERRRLDAAAFAVQNGGELGFGPGVFDVVLMLDVAEHVADLGEVLVGAARLVAPGGRLLVAFPPYHSPWGAHLFTHLPIPWVHLLFNDRDVLGLWREIHLEEVARGRTTVSASRARAIMKAARTSELWSCNELTIERFENLVREAGLKVTGVRLKALGGCGSVMSRMPRLREVLVTRVTAVLEP